MKLNLFTFSAPVSRRMTVAHGTWQGICELLDETPDHLKMGVIIQFLKMENDTNTRSRLYVVERLLGMLGRFLSAQAREEYYNLSRRRR